MSYNSLLNQVVAQNSASAEKTDVFQSALKIKQAVDAFKKVERLEHEAMVADRDLNTAVLDLTSDEFRLYAKITAEGL